MSIEITCPGCGATVRADERPAGRKMVCPKCQTVWEIAGAASGPPAASDSWYFRAGDGRQYGPVRRADLDEWVGEGRVDASCQIRQEGTNQWVGALEFFPHLADALAAAETQGKQETPRAASSPFAPAAGGVSQGSVNPFQAPPAYDMTVMGSGAAGISAGAVAALASTRPWVLFMAILILLGAALMLLASTFMLLGVLFSPAHVRMGIIQTMITLLGSLLYLVVGYYLLKYGRKIGHFLRTRSSADLEAALVAQKSFWKLVGIVVAVTLAIYLLMVVFFIWAVATMGPVNFR